MPGASLWLWLAPLHGKQRSAAEGSCSANPCTATCNATPSYTRPPAVLDLLAGSTAPQPHGKHPATAAVAWVDCVSRARRRLLCALACSCSSAWSNRQADIPRARSQDIFLPNGSHCTASFGASERLHCLPAASSALVLHTARHSLETQSHSIHCQLLYAHLHAVPLPP